MLSAWYDPLNWFWIVGSDESQAWSSASGCYVTDYPSDHLTHIASEAELNDVLRPHGLALPAPSVDDYKNAVQSHIDNVAKAKDYANGYALAGYATDPSAEYADVAQTFINWRSSIWTVTFEMLSAVQSGAIPQPTIPELIAMLPASPWPITPQVKD